MSRNFEKRGATHATHDDIWQECFKWNPHDVCLWLKCVDRESRMSCHHRRRRIADVVGGRTRSYASQAAPRSRNPAQSSNSIFVSPEGSTATPPTALRRLFAGGQHVFLYCCCLQLAVTFLTRLPIACSCGKSSALICFAPQTQGVAKTGPDGPPPGFTQQSLSVATKRAKGNE